MDDIYIKKLDELKLMYVKAELFPEGIKAAWDKLYSSVNSFKGRKCYGTSQCIGTNIEYRACVVQLDGDEPGKLGLESFTIPASNYAAKKLMDWQSQLPRIPEIFDELSSKHEIRKDVPFLEYYKSDTELILMVPVKTA